MNYQQELEQSLNYLKSPQAIKSLQADAYWPKWDSSWWHMLLLHEMGLTHEIPETVVESYIAAINRIPVKIFPIYPEDMPAGVDLARGSPCHCQLGHVYQVLAARGVDVDSEVNWLRPWFLKYQMADGGLNCDEGAYREKEEVPSSMVGTIPIFEAVLFHTNRQWTSEEEVFLKKGADFLIKRQLMLGSETKYNASERESAKEWMQLCFPRFYFYDVLRGLHALLHWSKKTGSAIPYESIKTVVRHLQTQFKDAEMQIGRQAYLGSGSRNQLPNGDWKWHPEAVSFPLMSKVSAVGQASPFLTKQWKESQQILSELKLI
ncbi:hypothetical protein [Pseudobdellovibrio exovorus]|uniref:Uncharacterized protein n=1 Tax=Pseudobdellovibrio exovorus JSS TaxID=1184267 RepID=M4VDW8_9BACT|nr:hypothetical protein [Pseudobdellovibrio exovorus]AGH96685.1 hypothetical protein A11Q_2469 [Pseudobdellovibrio exovorus JSS]